MIKWQDCFYLVPGSELSERSVRSSGSDQSLSLSARSNTHSVSVLTELAWPSMLIIMSSTFPVTGTVMTCSDLGLSWVWPLTWSPGRLGSRTVHSPSSNPKGSLQKKAKKKFTSWKGHFWPKNLMVKVKETTVATLRHWELTKHLNVLTFPLHQLKPNSKTQ